ncbi:MAG: hypothetical protein ACYCV7_05030 [Acidimicrobiales bacterium]
MKWTLKRTRLIGSKALLIGVISVVVAGSIGGTAYALTTSSSTAAPAVVPKAHMKHGTHHGHRVVPRLVGRFARMGEHAIHAQVVVPSKGSFLTYTLDRGVVTAVSPTSISLKEANGASAVDSVTSTTKVLPASVVGISGVHDGRHVVVVAENGAAKLVWLPGLKPRHVRGTVSSVSTTGITVARHKGKPVQAAINPSTKVLPASVGGISGIHDGEHVAVTEVSGNARVVRVFVPHAARSGASGNAPTSGTPTA